MVEDDIFQIPNDVFEPDNNVLIPFRPLFRVCMILVKINKFDLQLLVVESIVANKKGSRVEKAGVKACESQHDAFDLIDHLFYELSIDRIAVKEEEG